MSLEMSRSWLTRQRKGELEDLADIVAIEYVDCILRASCSADM